MSTGNGSIHVLPIVVMFLGVLVLAASIIGEFDGSRPLRGTGLFLGVLGIALLLGGALLLSAQ